MEKVSELVGENTSFFIAWKNFIYFSTGRRNVFTVAWRMCRRIMIRWVCNKWWRPNIVFLRWTSIHNRRIFVFFIWWIITANAECLLAIAGIKCAPRRRLHCCCKGITITNSNNSEATSEETSILTYHTVPTPKNQIP